MYKRIVVGTDGSASANIAVDAAIELARISGAVLHVVNAHRLSTAHAIAAGAELGVPAQDIVESNEALRVEAQRICDDVAQRAGEAGVQTEIHCVAGDGAEAILRVAEDAQCELLVVGNRG